MKIKSDPSKSIAENHLGIIVGRVSYWWKYLPQRTRAFYDRDDMISEVVAHVYARRGKYSSSRAGESTFVFRVSENKCRSILSHYASQQYTARGTIDLTPEVARHVSRPADEAEREEALNALERVIEYGSDAALDLLEAFLTESVGQTERITEKAVQDLKHAVRACSASRRDFELALRWGQA